MLDNLYLTVNGRYYAVENQVNLDDLLASRPGGVVRVKQPGMVGRLDQGQGDVQTAQFMLEYLETQKENRTGWTRYSQGLNADSLNQTATAYSGITGRGDMRLELIARNIASGLVEVFNAIIKHLGQHQSKAMTLRLSGNWVSIDPRAWRNKYDWTINVGLGTGSKDAQVQRLMMLLNIQQQAFQVGLVGPDNLRHTASKIVNALGFKDDTQFFPDPKTLPPRPPQPDPNASKLQADVQKTQAQMQFEGQKHQMEMQQRQAELQQEAEIRQQELSMEAQKQQAQAQNDMVERQHAAELNAQLEQTRLAFEQWKAKLDSETKIAVAQIGADAKTPAEPEVQDNTNQMLLETMTNLMQALATPKMIIHDENGRPIGVKPMPVNQNV